jgi:hypothetical protein
MTRVVISQPMYWPWPGFLEQMMLADIYIWLDDVQFSKGSFTNRIQIKWGDDRKWISIPLKGKGTNCLISDLQHNHDNWLRAHKEALKASFKKYHYQIETLSLLDDLNVSASLIDNLILSTELMAKRLKILPRQILRSSQLAVKSHSSRRVLDLVRAVNGSHYITGHGAARYLDHALFETHDIAVSYMDYNVKPWSQQGSEQSFTPYVTTLDLLAAEGHNKAREHLRPRIMSWRDFLALNTMP